MLRDVDIYHGIVILRRPADVVLDNISLRELAWSMLFVASAYQPTVVRFQFVRHRMRRAYDLRPGWSCQQSLASSLGVTYGSWNMTIRGTALL